MKNQIQIGKFYVCKIRQNLGEKKAFFLFKDDNSSCTFYNLNTPVAHRILLKTALYANSFGTEKCVRRWMNTLYPLILI